MLSEPASAIVRGYQLGNKLLGIVLNDRGQPQFVTAKANLDLWFSLGRGYNVKAYDSTGRLIGITQGDAAKWSGVTRQLDPLELAFFEIAALD